MYVFHDDEGIWGLGVTAAKAAVDAKQFADPDRSWDDAKIHPCTNALAHEVGVHGGDIKYAIVDGVAVTLEEEQRLVGCPGSSPRYHERLQMLEQMQEEEVLGLSRLLSTDPDVSVAASDLRIFRSALTTMYNALHQDQPECECCAGRCDLIVETAAGQTRNITKDIPVLINHLGKLLGEPAKQEEKK